ncbi:MAG: preprotein translocase subunit SecG [Acidobacteria bacterium]|nr:preprotein translocase subunit SecG [Acidobacteriota bacterium]
MLYLIVSVHVLVCVFLILVVLLQQGKGADLSVFGGGSTQTAFGARGATTFLHKLTVFSFIVFVLTTLGIGILQSGKNASVVGSAAGARKPATAPVRTPGGKAAPAVPAAPARPAGGPGAATPAAAPKAPAPAAPASKAPPPAPNPGTPR